MPLVTAVVALVAAGVAGIPSPAQAEAPKPTPASLVDDARRSGRPVPVPAFTDEYSTTDANPDGSLTTTYSSAPERVRRNGSWRPVDTTLQRQKDGGYRPAAAVADLTFGGGGRSTLVSLKQGADALTFTWPGKLPTAVVKGDTATYPEIRPGVDLQLTANATGYSSVFVVRTPQAASQNLDLGLTSNRLKIRTARNGGAEAIDVATGRTAFAAGTALMWDSSPSNDQPAGPTARVASAELVGAHQAQVKVGVSAGKQTLTLDRTLLAAKTTKYPVFVDPDWAAWSGNPSQLAWARISSNGWDIYNSTATTGSNSARIGKDDWPEQGGAGEQAHTYYQMNTSGLKGATIKSASMYVVHRWSASCTDTSAVLYSTGAIAKFDAAHLFWGHEPGKGTLLSTVKGHENGCGTKSPASTPASFQFNVTSAIKAAASAKQNSANFLIEAQSMTDKMNWKQLGYRGGARLSVQYSYPPTLAPSDGKQHVFPSVTDQGRTVTTTHTPTLSWRATNRFPNGVVRNVLIDYRVLDKTGKTVAVGYGPGPTSYSLNGTDWTVKPALPDGDYTWTVTAKNQDGLWAPAWGPTQRFTVDTAAPTAPSVQSSVFPRNQVGGAFTDQGTFVLGNDRTDNVTGYLFALDGDLVNTTYGNNKGTAWAAGTTPKPGVVYFAKADNANGTGTAVVNGTAGVTFAPGTAGAHRVFVKAVDQAGSTSPQTAYEFNAGRSTPTYAYGDQMMIGWTARNTDGTFTTVPKASTTTRTGHLIISPSTPGTYYVDGNQGLLADLSSISKVANGDTVTFWFDAPQTSLWEIGANVTTGPDYGTYSLTLDSATTLTPSGVDAYSPVAGTRYLNFGVLKNPLAQGLHSITLKLTGKNAQSTGFQAGIDVVRFAPTLICSINDTRTCLNDKAISTFTTGSVTAADADGWGWSLDAADLKSAGWAPGGTITVDGASVKLPATYGDGKNDSMLAAGQIVTVPSTGVTNKGNALVFVGFSVNGDAFNASGDITYAKDSRCPVSSQAYKMDWVSDYTHAPAGSAVLTLPHRNSVLDNTQHSDVPAGISAVSVPLQCPDTPITSVSLPLVSNTVNGRVNALHLLGLGVRPASRTGDDRWVGSWAAAQDTAAITGGSLTDQTVRIPAHLSVGTGTGSSKVRIRLANTFGKAPVTVDAASIALQDPGSGGAATSAAPSPLTFGGATQVTLQAGTDLLSDPVALTVPDNTTALVSLKIRGTPTALAGHQGARGPVYVAAGDHTSDTNDGSFSVSTMAGLPYLSGIDVSTPADHPAGAVVLFGDHTTDASDNLAADIAIGSDGGTYPLRAGVLNLGSTSGLLPRVTNAKLPQNAYGIIDRAILNQTNARIVLVSAGSNDVLACPTSSTADACANTVEEKLVALTSQLQQYKTDDAADAGVNIPTATRALKVYIATLPPFHGSHTAAQESARQLVNAYILDAGGRPTMHGYADGVVDFAAAVSSTGSAAGSAVKTDDLTGGLPNDTYYQDLARQYVTDADDSDGVFGDGEVPVDPDAFPAAIWNFGEGSGTVARDTGTGTGNPDNPVLHNATLTNVTWAPLGRQADSKAGTFNGTTAYADTKLDLNTAKSFTVTAWVKLTDKSADRTILGRNGTGNASLYLQYDKDIDRWSVQMPSGAGGDEVIWYDASSDNPAKVGVWTHLAAVFDATDHGLTLYVNGQPQGRADEVTAFHDLGQTTWIGRSTSTWFSGDISDVRVWQRVIGEQEVANEAIPGVPTVDWQFEDQSFADVATDSQGKADGQFAGEVSWATAGHTDSDGGSDGSDDDLGAVTVKPNGTISTRARIRTDQSFTISAWARITDGTRNSTVVSQAGQHSNGFQLSYLASCKCWRFVLPTTDGTNPAVAVVAAPSQVALSTWTHLAAVYDAATDTATLYVNGTAAASAARPVGPWNATGQFMVGAAHWNDGTTDYFTGDVDDVRAYQQALSADDITSRIRD